MTSLSLAAQNLNSVALVSAASFEGGTSLVSSGGIAVDSIVSAFGAKLATATATATDIDPNQPGIQLPETLAGTTVRVNGQPAKLLFVSSGQVNFIMPAIQFTIFEDFANVEILAADGVVSRSNISLTRVSPGIFTANADGKGVLAANVVRVRNGVRMSNEPVAQFDPVTKTYRAQPIDLGPPTDRVFLEVYCTGVRGADDPNHDGNVQENTWVLLGGQILTPTYAGRQPEFAGLDQVNFEIPRHLPGYGKLNLSIQARRKTENNDLESFAANIVELEVAAPRGANPPQITDFSPATAQVGQTLTITGEGFALTAADNLVKMGNAIARVESASATRLTVRVPYGATGGKITVRTPDGEGASSPSLALRTSISGVVEVAGTSLPDVIVRIVGTNRSVRTNADGVFLLEDVPVGETYLELDANVTAATMYIPKLNVRVPVVGNRDNFFPMPIRLSPSNPEERVVVRSGTGEIFRASPYVELADGAAVQLPDGTTNRSLAVTNTEGLPVVNPLAAKPFVATGRAPVLQIAPLGATFTAGAKLVIPQYFGPIFGTPKPRIYRYDLTPGSATFGMLVDVPDVTYQPFGVPLPGGSLFIARFEAPIRESGYYVVDITGTLLTSGSPLYPLTTTIGTLLELDGKTPVNQVLLSNSALTSNVQPLQTDDSGSYIIRQFTTEALFRYVQPDGTVASRKVKREFNPGVSAVPVKMSPPEPFSLNSNANMVLLPNAIRMKVNETRADNFLILNTGQLRLFTVTGAPFVSLIPGANGLYTLIFKPTTKDHGEFTLNLVAESNSGEKQYHSIRMLIEGPNTPPVITVPQAEYRMKVGETLSFPVTATDADAEQKVNLRLESSTLENVGNPAQLSFTYTPTANAVGTQGFVFSAEDDGFGQLRTMKSIFVRVEPVIKPKEWTLVSYGGLPTLLYDTVLYGEPVSFDSPDPTLGLIGTTRFSSRFGDGVYLSTDKGVTWTKLKDISVASHEYTGQVVGSEKLLMVEIGSNLEKRIYASINGGQNWTLFMRYAGLQTILAGDNRGNLLVRGSDGAIYRPTVDEAMIKLTRTNLPVDSRLKLIASAGNKLYTPLDQADFAADKLYASTDGGVTWTDVTAKFPIGDYKNLHVAGTRLFARTENGVFTSSDDGAAWNPVPGLPGNFATLSFASNQRFTFVLLNDGRIYVFPLT